MTKPAPSTPSIQVDVAGVDDETLDENIRVLLASHGDADRDLLAVLLVERHHRSRASESAAWLGDCETLWLLAEETWVSEQGDLLPLWMKYAPDGSWTWSSFALDILQIPAPTATSRKRVWEVYRRRLGWSPEVMARIGPSRLGVAVAEMERSLDDGDGPDRQLETLLLGSGEGEDPADWREVWLYCQQKGDERRQLAGKPARVSFREKFVVDEDTGEVVGFALGTWYGELYWELGRFIWDSKLPSDVRGVVEVSLMDALKRGPRRT